MAAVQLDRSDRRILAALQNNARISNLELADAVGLSPTPCARRVKRLEECALIRGHVTLLDQQQLGLNLTAFINISMDRHTPDRFDAFEAKVREYPEVIKAVIPDMIHYERFLLGHLTRIPGVTGVHSSFVLRPVVQRTALSLEHTANEHTRLP